MFWHFYKYRTKVLLRNKSMLFWTLAFPILLGLMFMAAFGEIDQAWQSRNDHIRNCKKRIKQRFRKIFPPSLNKWKSMKNHYLNSRNYQKQRQMKS